MITKFKEHNYLDHDISKVNTKIILDDSVPVNNNPKILQWFVNCQMISYRKKQKNLAQNLLIELEKLFGKSNKSLRLEFWTKVWVLKYDDLIFNVFTAKGKGTSIEICGYEYKDINKGTKEKEIIQFLEELHRLINLEK